MEPIDPQTWEPDLRRYGDPRLGGVFVARAREAPGLFRIGGGEALAQRLRAHAADAVTGAHTFAALASWEPVWIRAMPGRTRQEIDHARACLRACLAPGHDFLDDGIFLRKPPADAPGIETAAEACVAAQDVSCPLGPCDDRRLQRQVHSALRKARGRPRFLSWLDLGGPQPVTRREWWFDGRRLLLQYERHAGLSLRGPADLVGKVTALMGQRVPT